MRGVLGAILRSSGAAFYAHSEAIGQKGPARCFSYSRIVVNHQNSLPTSPLLKVDIGAFHRNLQLRGRGRGWVRSIKKQLRLKCYRQNPVRSPRSACDQWSAPNDGFNACLFLLIGELEFFSLQFTKYGQGVSYGLSLGLKTG
jgi:hypothetical protein